MRFRLYASTSKLIFVLTFLSCFRQEVRGSHPCLKSSERVLHCLTTYSRRLGCSL